MAAFSLSLSSSGSFSGSTFLFFAVFFTFIHSDFCQQDGYSHPETRRHAMHIEPAPNLGGLHGEYPPRHTRQEEYSEEEEEEGSLTPPSGARRLDTDNDLLYYEDIYPKRVPNVIHREWSPNPFAFIPQEERRPFSSGGEGQARHFTTGGHSGERWRSSSSGSALGSPSSGSGSGSRTRLRGRRRQDRLTRMRGQRRARKKHHLVREHRARSHSSDHDLSFRSMLGVAPYCLSEDSQFSCMFTPMCWMAGGIPQAGCESMLYSCCVPPALSRQVSDNKTQGNPQNSTFKIRRKNL